MLKCNNDFASPFLVFRDLFAEICLEFRLYLSRLKKHLIDLMHILFCLSLRNGKRWREREDWMYILHEIVLVSLVGQNISSAKQDQCSCQMQTWIRSKNSSDHWVAHSPTDSFSRSSSKYTFTYRKLI